MSKEQEIQESEQILQRLIDLLPSRIFWKDINLTYMGCNKNFANDSGLSSTNDLIGKTDFEMGWADQAEAYRADDQHVIDTGVEKVNYDEPQTTPEGKTIWLRTSKVPLVDPNGKIMGVLGMYEDITNRKLAQDQIQDQNEELTRINQLMVGRETKMRELKAKIEELEAKIRSLDK